MIQQSHFWVYSQCIEIRSSNIHLHSNTHCSTMLKNQEMEATQISNDGQMVEDNVVYTYNGTLYHF
jgi:hypothetical protein